MGRSVLVLMNQMAHDPTSGAARNMRAIAEVLASAGFRVRALTTSATESSAGLDAQEILAAEGIAASRAHDPAVGAPVLRFRDRGIDHVVLDVGIATPQSWEPSMGRVFDLLVREELESFVPEIVFTFGAFENEVRRRIAARRRGATIVFALQNLSYLDPRAFVGVDAVAAVSQFVASVYRQRIGLESEVAPPVLTMDDVLVEPGAGSHRCVTFVNPTKAKGVMFFARLADELSRARPGVPVLVVEARGTAADLLEAGRAGGIDLSVHKNIVVSKPVARPRQFLAPTRVLVAPSPWPEAFGRVAAEAMVNGIPSVVADRGGLPEAAAGGGYILPIPDEYTPDTDRPVSADAVRRWRDTILMLLDDEAVYAAASARAREAGRRYLPESVRPRILTFFARVCRAPGDTMGPFSKGR